jgi:hypothetical protein
LDHNEETKANRLLKFERYRILNLRLKICVDAENHSERAREQGNECAMWRNDAKI